MANEKDEKEIAALMKNVRLKSVPPAFLENYEQEVWARIRRPAFPVGVAFVCAAALIGMAVLGYGLWQTININKSQHISLSSPNAFVGDLDSRQKHAGMTKEIHAKPPQEEKKTEFSDQALDNLAREVLVLQWLGEDSGLLDDL